MVDLALRLIFFLIRQDLHTHTNVSKNNVLQEVRQKCAAKMQYLLLIILKK